MLHERTEEAMGYFSEGRECAYFSDADELIEKIEYYLVHEEERRALAEAGHRRCITSGYSADDRINSIIAKYRELRRRRNP
jgi:spore maturation protein CgeB